MGMNFEYNLGKGPETNEITNDKYQAPNTFQGLIEVYLEPGSYLIFGIWRLFGI
jgi:hypothetical protein